MADSQFEQALAKANGLVTQGKLDEAASLYEQLVAHDPQNLELYREMALVYERKGDIPKAINTHLRWAGVCAQLGMNDEALKLYNQVLSVEAAAANPEKKGLFKSSTASPEKIRELVASARPEISLYIGHIYLQKMMADEAIKYLKGALDSSAGAQDHRVHSLLGIAYMQKNMDKEAIGEFQEVVRLAPNDAAFAYEKLGEIFHRAGKPTASTIVWYRNAGDLYLRNEQYQEAVGAYEMILQFEPRNKDVLGRLADIYTQQGMNEQALTTWRMLAQIYTEEGLLDKVIILYEKLTEMNPDDNESWDRLLEIYRGILQRDPSNLSVRLKLIKHLMMRGDHQSAIPEYLALAHAYLEKGVLDEAWQVLQKVLEFDPQHPRVLEMLGDIHMRRDEKDEGLQRYLEVLRIYKEAGDEEHRHELSQKLTAIFPEDSNVQYEVAKSLKEQGSYSEALSEIMKVLEQDPSNVKAMSEASELLLQMGRGEEARVLFTRILELEPTRTDVRLKLFEHALATHDVDGAAAQADSVAAALREAGMLREAEMIYRRMLNYYPDSAEIRLQICQLRLQQGDVDRVLQEYLLLANMFVRRQLLERAAELYGAILQYRPDLLGAHRSLGRVLARQGQTTQALGHFAHLAQEYLKRNLADQALAVLRESVDLEPSNVDLRERLVELLVRQLRIEEASEEYKVLARRHLEAGRLEEASRHVRECISLQPVNLDLRLELATLYLEFNRLEEGQALLQELVDAYLAKGETARVIDIYDRMAHIYRVQERHDLYWQARERTAELYRHEGRNAEALAELQEIVEGALRQGEMERARTLFGVLAGLYEAEGRIDDGVRTLERLVESFARDGQSASAEVTQDFLIQLLERKGDQGQALHLLVGMASRAQESGDAELAFTLFGRVYEMLAAVGELDEAATTQLVRIKLSLAKGDIETARGLWAELQRLRPQVADDAARYADLLYEHEHHDDARPILASIVEHQPENVEARTRLAVISARAGDMAAAAALARTLLASGLVDRVLGEFSRAGSGADAEREIRFAAFHEAMGFYEEALGHYQRAARDPGHRLAALNGMAFLFRRAGYTDLAVRQFIRILEQPGYDDEELLETRFNLATLYYEAGRYAEALEMYNECATVRLRYRDVAERIEELTSLVASGSVPRADVLPFTAPREGGAATPAPEPEAEAAVETAPPEGVGAALEDEATEAATTPEGQPAVVAEIEPSASTGAAETVEPSVPEPEPPVAEVPPAAAEAEADSTARPVVESPQPPPSFEELGDDDFFLEGPPPDPAHP